MFIMCVCECIDAVTLTFGANDVNRSNQSINTGQIARLVGVYATIVTISGIMC